MLASALVLALRLRRPRPPIRRIARQPGASACFAAVTYGLSFDLDVVIHQTILWRWPGPRPHESRSIEQWIWFLTEPPSACFTFMIPIIWSILALGRCWHPEPGWIDRSGRLLGLAWIAWAIAEPFQS